MYPVFEGRPARREPPGFPAVAAPLHSVWRAVGRASRRTACALAVLLAFSAALPAQTVIADYRLGGTLVSSVGTPPALSFLGNAAFATEVVDGFARTAAAFPAGDGLALTNASALMSNSYTIVLLLRLETGSGWRRVIDFKNRTSDLGLYLVYDNLNFFNLAAGAGGAVKPGAFIQVAVTREPSGRVTAYVNGSPELAFDDVNGDALPGTGDPLILFRDDLEYPNDHAAGALARLRFFNGSLSAAQVAALDRLHGVTGVTAPVIGSPAEANGIAGAPFRFQVAATQSPGDFSATGLPDWASLDHATGLIAGAPLVPGTNLVRVSANNAAGSATQTLTLTIRLFALTAGRVGDAPALILEGPLNRSYRIEHAPAVPPPSGWIPLTNVTATTSPYTVIDPSHGNADPRFYRAVLLE